MSPHGTRIQVRTDDGQVVSAIAPLVISASRATDIPAFFAPWFFSRLEKGYVKWINPFRPRHPVYVSFARTKVIVFWTKNPEPILPFLPLLDQRKIRYYFHVTLNDYDAENFEPGVPPLPQRLSALAALSDRITRNNIVWRFDPLILTPTLTLPELADRIRRLGERVLPHACKLVYSHVTIAAYKKVRDKLVREQPDVFRRETLHQSEFTPEQKIEFAAAMVRLRAHFRKTDPDVSIHTCAEPLDLTRYGIPPNSCIDPVWIARLWVPDNGPDMPAALNRRDSGQRPACGCCISKDIGAYNTCRHHCIYCYANTSARQVEIRLRRIRDHGDVLAG